MSLTLHEHERGAPRPLQPRRPWYRLLLTVLFVLVAMSDGARQAGRTLRRWAVAAWPEVRAWVRAGWHLMRRASLVAGRWAISTATHAAHTAAHAATRAAAVAGLAAWRSLLAAWRWVARRRPSSVGLRRPSWVALAVVGCFLAGSTAALAAPEASVRTVADVVSWRNAHVQLPPLAERSVVYAADGSVMAVLHASENRVPVGLDHVAPVLVNAIIDTEDARFWRHNGVDVHALIRAAFTDLSSGHARQGASTIAQQLAKIALLSPKRDLLRKLQQIVLAERLERRFGKRAVLERYLNTVYFGEGAYGVEAAAETYFGKNAAHVDAAQAALLAGLIQDPDGYDPLRHATAAKARRATVLGLLVLHGHLDRSAGQQADATSLPTRVHTPPAGRDFFTDAVKQELLADPRLGATPSERYRAVFAGGLRIHTTLDPQLQAKARAAVAAGLPSAGIRLTAALAAVDPVTGAVRALVGGPDYGSSQYDAALGVGRQTGSAFKTFTLVAALEQGYSPQDVIDGSSPCTIANPGGTPNPWTPSNFEGEAFGPISLSEATARSVNCAYARLAMMVGLGNIASVAKDMGVSARLAPVPSMTLGTNDVPPLQMAAAYATLADGGVAHRAHLIQEVDGPDGKPIVTFHDRPHRVMSNQIAAEATQVLQSVVFGGTGTAAAVPGRQVAGKTGTAEGFQDAWFVGYAPQLATAVWMGDPDGEVPMTNIAGINVVGGSFPAQMWSHFMGDALGALPVVPLAAPDPAQVPPGVSLVLGQPRGAGGPVAGGSSDHTRITTWCWSSCGH